MGASGGGTGGDGKGRGRKGKINTSSTLFSSMGRGDLLWRNYDLCRGGRAVRVRQGRRCAPIMINAPPSSWRQPSRTTLLPPAPPLTFPFIPPLYPFHSGRKGIQAFDTVPVCNSFLAFPPYPSFPLCLSMSLGLAGRSGHDRSTVPQLCSCRTGRSLLSWTSALCLCQRCHRFPP